MEVTDNDHSQGLRISQMMKMHESYADVSETSHVYKMMEVGRKPMPRSLHRSFVYHDK
jgi:hypothetical protein